MSLLQEMEKHGLADCAFNRRLIANQEGKPTIDRRYKFVRETMDRARPQMINYFAARYSWGQPCDPQRAKDWATLAGYLATCQAKGMDPEWDKRFSWESGNHGTPSGMVDCYHDGWELLSDLGLYDPDWD